ncbi:MAG: PEP-CTERM sorting domain-containing protein [Verrucomicrobiae bacterium]|nr:PEP-CTERM sorting domain-containing protein [Verrucomicrobiae bacterium]
MDLADPAAPSLTPIFITFNGFRADGSMVSQTFTVGGGGSSSFQTFYFNAAFAHGLVRVEIPSPAWAMDNLVWIPEPGPLALLGLGLVALAWRRFPRRKT